MFRKYKNWVFILAAEVIMTSNSTGYSKRDAKSAGICEYLLVCKGSDALSIFEFKTMNN